MKLVIDFETRSVCDLKKVGSSVYAQHPDTLPMVLSVLSIKDDGSHDEPRVWVNKHFRKLYDTEIQDNELDTLIQTADRVIIHNMFFEMSIWHYIMASRYGFQPINVCKVHDTMTSCAAVGIPLNLEKASAFMNPDDQIKDMEGSKIMKRFISPRPLTKAERLKISPDDAEYPKEEFSRIMEMYLSKGRPIPSDYQNRLHCDYHKLFKWYEDKEDFERMVQYCRQDVISTYALYKQLPKRPHFEDDIWELDYKINMRGVLVDVEAAKGVISTLDEYTKELKEEVEQITDGQVKTMKSVPQVKAWLASFGITPSSIDKAAVLAMLERKDLPDKVRRFLEIRQILGRSAVAKYDAMLTCSSPTDNRVRGSLLFAGAQTARWVGRLLQVQNLPRPSGLKNLIGATKDTPEEEGDITEGAISLISSGDPHICQMFYKDVTVLASDSIRGMIIAPEGKDIICSDFSAVEGRFTSYIANEEEELKAYRAGKDIYKVNASMIFGIPYEEVDGGGKGVQRQTGKCATLSCGYSGGYGAMLRFSYDRIPLTEKDAYHTLEVIEESGIKEERLHEMMQGLVNYADEVTDYTIILRQAYETPKTKEKAEMFLKEIKGHWIVRMWRKNHPNTVKLWRVLRDAAMEAASFDGSKIETSMGRTTFRRKGRYLMMELPSGRSLFYLDPKIEEVTTPWGAKQTAVTVVTTDSMTKQLTRRILTSAILTENLVQASCRDLLKESMLRLERNRFEIVMHVHDEIISLVDEGTRSVKEFEEIMSQTPDWAKGMPLLAKGGYRSKRYKK